MTHSFNLPAGVWERDLEGDPLPQCAQCGAEYEELDENELCTECQEPDAEADWADDADDSATPGDTAESFFEIQNHL